MTSFIPNEENMQAKGVSLEDLCDADIVTEYTDVEVSNPESDDYYYIHTKVRQPIEKAVNGLPRDALASVASQISGKCYAVGSVQFEFGQTTSKGRELYVTYRGKTGIEKEFCGYISGDWKETEKKVSDSKPGITHTYIPDEEVEFTHQELLDFYEGVGDFREEDEYFYYCKFLDEMRDKMNGK